MIVRPYDAYEAEGNSILGALQKAAHWYNSHVFISKNKKAVILVTNKSVGFFLASEFLI